MNSVRSFTNKLQRYAVLALCLTAMVLATPAAAETVYLDFTNNGLEQLGDGWAYEGWLIVNGAPVSTGTFSIDMHGMAHPSRTSVELEDAADATTFVLTIEPVPDDDPAPSVVHVLAGDFSGDMAELSAGHAAALGDDFQTATGPYILNAPSGGEMAEYQNGIWWLDPMGGHSATLELPTLPDGWAYEGWVVGPEGPMSTGRFLTASGADSDGQGITGGPYEFPPFPGQDLVVPTTDLTAGYAAVVSIEPSPDDSPAPFAFKPLVDMNIDDVGAGVLQTMNNNASAFPSATVTMNSAAEGMETAHLMLDFDGLEDLGPDYAYEGWLIVDGAPVSTGVFNVSGGVLSQSYFPTMVSSREAIEAFVLTIEPVPDSDPAPSAVHLLAGDLIGTQAKLSTAHGAAIGTDFSTMMGSYILNAPSSGGSVPYTHGIWWLDPEGGHSATLELPSLPEGWVYEGWVAGADGPLSTGRFSVASGADSDGAGETGGSEDFPPFPGQDFVMPPTDLTSGYAAVISVEPEPDNSPAPFAIKPLLDPMIDALGAGILQPMHANLGSVPSGTAMLGTSKTIPAAASTTGVGGARWYTDIDIANSDSRLATVHIQLLPSEEMVTTPETVSFNLSPGMAMRYKDALVDLFDFTGTAALRIVADSDAVQASSRTYAATEDGSYGQGIPAFATSAALGYGEVGRLLQLSEGETFRTNIGFVNADVREVMVHYELYANDGALIDSDSLTLRSGEHEQLNRAYPQDAEIGWARVWTSTPGGHFFAYASVVDNGVDDPTFIVAQ